MDGHHITGHAKLAGVIGWPITHSKSPKLHNYWLRRYGIDGAYVPLPVAPDNLERVMRAMPAMGFLGYNITIPHKTEAMKYVDHLHPLAVRVGAINTVIIKSDGSTEGRNTDVFGFSENLRYANFEGRNKTVTVLGSGGAARAIIISLLDMGCSEIRIVNRSKKKAEDMAGELNDAHPNSKVHVFDWDYARRAMQGSALLVNTTSLGMVGQPALDLDITDLPYDAYVTDIVYNPLETDLLKKAKERGLHTVDGLGMLLHQARPGFAAWFGREPEVNDDLRRHILTGS